MTGRREPYPRRRWRGKRERLRDEVSPQSENVLFCKVEMSYSRIVAPLPFPSGCIVLHRGRAVKAALRRIDLRP